MKHNKTSIQKGMFMMRDGPGPLAIKYSAPPPRYGAPPSSASPPSFAEIGKQLDDAKRRLEEIARQVRDARRQ